jgi:hypothetical protein
VHDPLVVEVAYPFQKIDHYSLCLLLVGEAKFLQVAIERERIEL